MSELRWWDMWLKKKTKYKSMFETNIIKYYYLIEIK